MRTIQRDIVGAFIFSADNKLLLGKSGKGGVYTDMWIPPGGGVEAGETKLEAVKREVLEEVGIDLSDATFEELNYAQKGSSEKTLKDTGERVLVEMTFYDFAIRIGKSALEITMSCDDDLAVAEWFDVAELEGLSISESAVFTLKKLGYLANSDAT